MRSATGAASSGDPDHRPRPDQPPSDLDLFEDPRPSLRRVWRPLEGSGRTGIGGRTRRREPWAGARRPGIAMPTHTVAFKPRTAGGPMSVDTLELGRDAIRRHAWMEAMEAFADGRSCRRSRRRGPRAPGGGGLVERATRRRHRGAGARLRRARRGAASRAGRAGRPPPHVLRLSKAGQLGRRRLVGAGRATARGSAGIGDPRLARGRLHGHGSHAEPPRRRGRPR